MHGATIKTVTYNLRGKIFPCSDIHKIYALCDANEEFLNDKYGGK